MKAISWMTAVLSAVLLGNICHGENKIEADNDVLIKNVRGYMCHAASVIVQDWYCFYRLLVMMQ